MSKKKVVKRPKPKALSNKEPITSEVNNVLVSKKKKPFAKVFLLYFSVFCVIFGLFLGYRMFFGGETKSNNDLCVNNSQQAEQRVREIPEVKKYFKSLKNDIDNPFVKIEATFDNKTKVGYAYVGKESENNSKTLFAKYLFTTGCRAQFEKQPIDKEDSNFSPINFLYEYKVAEKKYIDETKLCRNKISTVVPFYLDKDQIPEYLYGCYTENNIVEYLLYKTEEGIVFQKDDFTSAEKVEEVGDFNNDGYPDVVTIGILLDEGNCKGDACFAPVKAGEQPKYLLKQAYHRLWNPKTGKFDPPTKAEIYYNKDGEKIVVSN